MCPVPNLLPIQQKSVRKYDILDTDAGVISAGKELIRQRNCFTSREDLDNKIIIAAGIEVHVGSVEILQQERVGFIAPVSIVYDVVSIAFLIDKRIAIAGVKVSGGDNVVSLTANDRLSISARCGDLITGRRSSEPSMRGDLAPIPGRPVSEVEAFEHLASELVYDGNRLTGLQNLEDQISSD